MPLIGNKRFEALDGLRGVAVMQIVIYHYYLMLPIDAEWYHVLQRLGNAIDGVTLFFVLSGFLIGGILLDARAKPDAFRVFYVRRFFRILPLYGLLLFTYWVIRLVDNHWKFGFIYHWYSPFSFSSYLLFFQNEQMVRLSVLGAPWLMVTWSLAVEQQFYLIAPLVVRYVSDRRLLVVVCVAIIFVSVLHRETSLGLHFLLVDCLDSLAVGVVLAIIMRNDRARKLIEAKYNVLRLLVFVYFVVLVSLRIAGASCILIDNRLIASLLYAFVIGMLIEYSPSCAVRLVLVPIGLWSYFIYLFHMPVAFMFIMLLPDVSPLALPVTIGLAAVSYRYFEQPLIQWGRSKERSFRSF